MKKLCFFLAICASSALATNVSMYNGTYSIAEYTWCNGPLYQTTPGACSYFGWNGVDLDSIILVHVDFTESKQFIKLVDDKGKIWEKNLLECTAAPHEPSGCKSKVNFKNDREMKVTVHEWSSQAHYDKRFSLSFEDDELSIMAPDNALLGFKIIKKQ